MAEKKTRVTIKDVAKKAGVSISTVSNALNNVDVLTPETKEKILSVAEELNYIPNLNGRNLKAQATKVLGLYLGSIRGPYYGELTDSIFRACQNSDYDLEIFLSNDYRKIMSNILGKRVDGAIILNGAIKKKQEETLVRNDIPVVYIDRKEKNQHVSSVVFDSRKGGESVAKYLLELGHKRIMFVSGEKDNYDAIERQKGFTEVLKRAGIKLTSEDILEGNFERNASYNSICEYLEKGGKAPDAIFAANDLSAIGVIEALKDNGIKVPEDVSVIGCDDIETTRLVSPTITTIRTTFEKQGALAVDELIRLIQGEKGRITELSGRIIPRESTMIK